jgi:hypothetical protein
MSDSESVYFTNVSGTVGKYSSKEIRQELAKMNKHINPILVGRYKCVQLGRGERSFTAYELLDTLVNGSVFHVFEKHAEAAVDIESLNPGFYFGNILREFVYPVLNACWYLLWAIKSQGLIENSNFHQPSDQ